MKARNPIDRFDLKIKRNDLVLEVGNGNNPTYRASVLVEKNIKYNYHRSGDLRIFPHQRFVIADGENLPFKDKEFDYVICNHVLEHVEDPISFISELQRVAKRGYIETPSFIGESLFPKESHKWLCLEIDNKIVLYEKNKVPPFYPDFGTTFLNYLPYCCVALRIFYLSNHQIHTMRYEWRDGIDILVNPEDEYFSRFFTQAWTDEMRDQIFPHRSKIADVCITGNVFLRIIFESIKNKLFKRHSLGYDQYLELKEKS
ncbi:hypothetical protein MASR1M31_02580 [Porphyromonadaceae bacterium]